MSLTRNEANFNDYINFTSFVKNIYSIVNIKISQFNLLAVIHDARWLKLNLKIPERALGQISISARPSL